MGKTSPPATTPAWRGPDPPAIVAQDGPAYKDYFSEEPLPRLAAWCTLSSDPAARRQSRTPPRCRANKLPSKILPASRGVCPFRRRSMTALFPPTGVRVFTVGELTRAVKGRLEEYFGEVWVEGEVSNLARPNSGHVYLTLKDDEAPLRAVVYRGVALRLRFDLRDGMRVIARGRLSVYVPRGDYQLLVEELQPKGIGPLELAFRQLKEKLFVAGYFDPARKKALPRFPRRVALVTSPTGSAVRDVLEVLGRRWPGLEVWVCPVRVQGDGAAAEVAAAVGLLNAVGGPDTPRPLDVLLIARGGGSLEDL